MRKAIPLSFVIGQSQTGTAQMNEQLTPVGVVITGSSISGSLVSFLGSDDGASFYSVFNSSSTEVTLTTTSSARSYALDPNAFLGWNHIKARLGTSGSAKLQATYDQGILLLCKTIK